MNATTATPSTDASLSGARSWFAEKGLTRPREKRLISGVSTGLARRYGVNPLVMRLLSLMSVLFLSPLPYVALWVLMPRDS
jgi:phage shock protein C